MPDPRQLILNDAPFNGKSVLYIMSRDQRVNDNHALLAAQALAQEQKVPLVVLFVLRKVGVRSREHYQFMLDGLREVSKNLEALHIPFILQKGTPHDIALETAKDIEAGALFFDFNPLKNVRDTVKAIAHDFHGHVRVVDAHNIIPTWVVSDKREFAAHTMRTKVHKKLEEYLISPATMAKQVPPSFSVASLSFEDAEKFIATIPASGITVSAVPGEQAARDQLGVFIDSIELYAKSRNNIAQDHQSGLSPYLHFGQISSLTVALEVITAVNEPPLLLQRAKLLEPSDTPNREDGMNALLEEMIVRKELSDNFCFYTDDPTSLKSAPEWAQKSLATHSGDVRDFTYTKEEWETAKTHDEIWNAAQLELAKTGKMHGYMRMYWAKKMLEWSASPQEAIDVAVYLNDTYSIDGGDPNGYVGILWSIAGLHDRPWFERPVYGQIRYMNSGGLRRKFKVDDYIQRVESL